MEELQTFLLLKYGSFALAYHHYLSHPTDFTQEEYNAIIETDFVYNADAIGQDKFKTGNI